MIEKAEKNANQDDELAFLIQALERDYAEKLPTKFTQMHAALHSVRDNLDDAEKRKDAASVLFHLVHSLSGSAGSFGFTALGVQARHVEKKMAACMTDDAWSEQVLTELSTGLSELEEHLSVFKLANKLQNDR